MPLLLLLALLLSLSSSRNVLIPARIASRRSNRFNNTSIHSTSTSSVTLRCVLPFPFKMSAPEPEAMEAVRFQLTQMHEMFMAQMKAMQEALASQTAETRQLRDELEMLKSRSSTPQITVTPPDPGQQEPEILLESGNGSKPSKPKPRPTPSTLPDRESLQLSEKLPDPPIFSGKRKDLPAFLSRMKYKLEGNADRFTSPRSQLLYAHSRLEGDAATLVQPLMDTDITTANHLLAFLEATYGDPNRRDTALARLGNLRQDKKGFLAHFADFRRIASDSGLNEVGLVMQLKRSLSDDLRRAMVGVKVPDNLNDYANLITMYDNDLRYLPKKAPAAPRAARPTRDPDAMDIDNIHHDYAPKGSDERKRREQKGLCFKCGSNKHISPDCSKSIPGMNVRSSMTHQSQSRSSSRGRRSRRSSSGSIIGSTRSARSNRNPSGSSKGSNSPKDRS